MIFIKTKHNASKGIRNTVIRKTVSSSRLAFNFMTVYKSVTVYLYNEGICPEESKAHITL